ncbi:MAG: sulfurtransferase TusA family protein [Kofleriaceae bacterium]
MLEEPDTSASTAGASWSERDAYLDLRGEVCPFTFVRTKLALEELTVGAILRVFVDHPPASVQVPRSVAAWGQRVLAVQQLPDGWHLDLQKAHD